MHDDDTDDQPGIIHSDDQTVVHYPDGRKSVHFRQNGVYTREVIILSADNSLLEEKRHDGPDGVTGTIKKYDEDTRQLTTTVATVYDPASRQETCHLTFSQIDPGACRDAPLIGVNHYTTCGQLRKVSNIEHGHVVENAYLTDFVITESHFVDREKRIESYQDGDNTYMFRNADHDERQWAPYGELTLDDVDVLGEMIQEARIMEVIDFEQGEMSLLFNGKGRLLFFETVIHDPEQDIDLYKIHVANPADDVPGGIEYLINVTRDEILEEKQVDATPAHAVLAPAALAIFESNNAITARKALPPSPWC